MTNRALNRVEQEARAARVTGGARPGEAHAAGGGGEGCRRGRRTAGLERHVGGAPSLPAPAAAHRARVARPPRFAHRPLGRCTGSSREGGGEFGRDGVALRRRRRRRSGAAHGGWKFPPRGSWSFLEEQINLAISIFAHGSEKFSHRLKNLGIVIYIGTLEQFFVVGISIHFT